MAKRQATDELVEGSHSVRPKLASQCNPAYEEASTDDEGDTSGSPAATSKSPPTTPLPLPPPPPVSSDQIEPGRVAELPIGS